MYWLLNFVSTTFSTQPHTLFVFLQSETDSSKKQDKTRPCKHQINKGVITVREIDKYIVSFFFDDKGLKFNLLK